MNRWVSVPVSSIIRVTPALSPRHPTPLLCVFKCTHNTFLCEVRIICDVIFSGLLYVHRDHTDYEGWDSDVIQLQHEMFLFTHCQSQCDTRHFELCMMRGCVKVAVCLVSLYHDFRVPSSTPKGRPGMSDVIRRSRILGLSFDSSFPSPVVVFLLFFNTSLSFVENLDHKSSSTHSYCVQYFIFVCPNKASVWDF